MASSPPDSRRVAQTYKPMYGPPAVRLRVGTSGAGPGPNAVRPYVARCGEVGRIVCATPREKPRTSRTGRYLGCDSNQLWIQEMVCPPVPTFSTTPALGAPPRRSALAGSGFWGMSW
jgi:hypothetical protein